MLPIEYNGLEVAIIGMSGKFPGADNVDQLWENLMKEVESISFFTENELKEAGVSENLYRDSNYINAKGYIKGAEFFDFEFFGYSPIEAQIMDPQIRLFHQVVYNALEDAGYPPEKYNEQIGLFCGATSNFLWEVKNKFENSSVNDNSLLKDLLSDKDLLSMRISYCLNLSGPSVTLFNACSTSMVSIHMACRALIGGDCGIALAGGISLANNKKEGYLFEEGMTVSSDGHTRAFSDNGRGFVPGNGCGVVVLKLLEDAITDGDHIYAVIKGSSINNDGKRKIGFSAPSVEGQCDVIKSALKISEVDPATISYVECHGSATAVGDPIEIEALKRAYDVKSLGSIAIGTIKTNIGHLDAAAGVSGIIKTSLCLKHKIIPASLFYNKSNPNIDFENSPFYVNTKTKDWQNSKHLLRAGVNSFGQGGTNVHAILEEVPKIEPSSEGREYKLLLISGKTLTAADNNTISLGLYLRKHPDINLADAAYTLQVGRQCFKNRRMFLCRNIEEGIKILECTDGIKANSIKEGKSNIVFMFPGQGSQYVNMGRELYEKESYFRNEFDKCFEIFKRYENYDIKDVLYPHINSDSVKDIDKTSITQPVLFIFEYVLARMLMNLGVRPDCMIGYSIGEYTAACIAGVFTFEDALRLLLVRGKLMECEPDGSMLSVPLNEKELLPFLDETISLAVVNGASCIISGEKVKIDIFEEKMKSQKILCMRIGVSHAGHSKNMSVILDEFAKEFKQVKLNIPLIKYISGITGNWIKDSEATSWEYWVNHIVKTVRFSQGVLKLAEKESVIFIEIGPGRDLGSMIRRHIEKKTHHIVNLIRNNQMKISDLKYFTQRLGELWLYGVNINWANYYIDERRLRIPLPGYNFDNQKFETTIDVSKIANDLFKRYRKDYVKIKHNISDWYNSPSWKSSPLLDTISSKNASTKNTYLMFVTNDSLSIEFSNMLKKIGHVFFEVKIGNSFSVDGNIIYINPENDSDYILLCDTLKKCEFKVDRLLHLWSYGCNSDCCFDSVNHIEVVRGYKSTLKIIQLLESILMIDCKIIHITSNMNNVLGLEQVYAERSMLKPLLITISQETGLFTKLFDIDNDIDKSKIEMIIKMIISDYESEDNNKFIVYRNGIRWRETYEQLNLGVIDKSGAFKKGGIYILTGGFGRIGLDIAEYIGKEYKAKLVLVSRSIFPPREDWESWIINNPSNDKTTTRIKLFQEIELAGGQIFVHNCDVSDSVSMECIFNQTEQNIGAINGVFHLAGVVESKYNLPINNITQEVIDEHFRAKLDGVVVLNKLLKSRNVDFCLITSSMSTILGGMKLGAYGASNIYMNSYVSNIADKSIPWLLVCIHEWTSSRYDDVKDEKRFCNISEEKKNRLESILQIHNKGVSYVIEFSEDIEDAASIWVNNNLLLTHIEGISKEQESGNFAKYNRPHLTYDYVEPSTEIEKKIALLWRGFFKYERIGILDDFFELGGDSLKAMTILAHLQKEFSFRITVKDFFDRPNIKLLSEYIDNILTIKSNSKFTDDDKRKVVEL